MKKKPEVREGNKKESRALERRQNGFSEMGGKKIICLNIDKIWSQEGRHWKNLCCDDASKPD